MHNNRTRINRALPLDSQKYDNLSLTRIGKQDSISTRSPFSKLTVQDYDTGAPTEGLKARGQHFSGSSKTARGYGATGITYSDFEHLPASPDNSSINYSRLLSQEAHHPPHLSFATSFQKSATERDPSCKTERDDYGEHITRDPDVHANDSAVVTQPFHKSFKKEADASPTHIVSHSGVPRALQEHFCVSASGKSSGRQANLSISQGRSNTSQFLSQSSQMVRQASLSRESSVAPTRDQSGEDLSALLFKGATDLRNTNMALEEKVNPNPNFKVHRN